MKVVNLIGNIKDNLTYRLCPNTEFSTGSWQIALSAICAEAREDINTFVNITSSVSVSQKYTNGEIAVYEQPLNTVYLSLRKTGKSINRFSDPLYLDINRQSEEIEFNFYDSLTGKRLIVDVKIALNVFFKRVT